MAGKSLSEIVNAALGEADTGLKLASARDAEPGDPGDFLAAELLTPKTQQDTAESDAGSAETETKAEEPKTASAKEVLDDANYAMKLAEALELASSVVTKLATSPLDAPGPQIMESGFEGAQTQKPTPPGTAAKPLSPGAGIAPQTNAEEHSGVDWTKNKEASARLLRAKLAQAEMLTRLGQHDVAQRILAEVEKKAEEADDSAAVSAHGDAATRLDTEPGNATVIPDNAGLISMTRAQARDKSTREASEYIMETPKVDNAVAAHALATTGLKTSGDKKIQEMLKKDPGIMERLHGVETTLRESPGFNTAGGGISGGLYGGALGGLAGMGHGSSPKAALIGAGLGAAAGATGGALLGRHSAHGAKANRLRMEQKSASMDPDAARAYLKKVAALGSDPDATPEERVKAARLIEAVKARTQVDPETLLKG